MTTVEQVAVNRYKAEHKRGKSKFKHNKHVEKAKPEQNQYTNTNLFRMMQMNLALAPSDSIFTSLPDFNASTNPFANNFNSPIHNEKREVTPQITPFKLKPKEAPAEATEVAQKKTEPTNAKLISTTISKNKKAFGASAIELKYGSMIDKIANKKGVDPNLVRAMIQQESGGDPYALSGAGAAGLMQLMPETAKKMGLNPKDRFNAEKNIQAGTKYIKKQLDRFNGNVSLALAAYNAGPGNVKKHGGIPPFKETRNYVAKVTEYHKSFQEKSSATKNI